MSKGQGQRSQCRSLSALPVTASANHATIMGTMTSRLPSLLHKQRLPSYFSLSPFSFDRRFPMPMVETVCPLSCPLSPFRPFLCPGKAGGSDIETFVVSSARAGLLHVFGAIDTRRTGWNNFTLSIFLQFTSLWSSTWETVFFVSSFLRKKLLFTYYILATWKFLEIFYILFCIVYKYLLHFNI